MIKPRILPTFELTALASVLIVITGVALGMIAALRAGGPMDMGVSLGVLIAAAVSPAIMSLILISVFAVDLGWFPALGLGDGGALDRLHHLILPAVALAASASRWSAATTRVSMIRSARAGVHRDRAQPRPLAPQRGDQARLPPRADPRGDDLGPDRRLPALAAR